RKRAAADQVLSGARAAAADIHVVQQDGAGSLIERANRRSVFIHRRVTGDTQRSPVYVIGGSPAAAKETHRHEVADQNGPAILCDGAGGTIFASNNQRHDRKGSRARPERDLAAPAKNTDRESEVAEAGGVGETAAVDRHR